MSDDLPAIFEAKGVNDEGKPKWLWFQCQAQGAEPGDRCCVSVNGQKNGSGASWTCPMADREKMMMTPTVNPSIRCGDRCHFWIRDGRFVYEPDHKGERRG